MRKITLLRVVIKNFRSYKDDEVALTQTVGLKMLSGKNNAEPRLGSNGAGKSTFWEAVTWCLYGVGIKGAKISSLLSWGSSKAEVFLYIEIDKQTHLIHRHGPPMKIDVDGKPATQESIDTLVGLSCDKFLHSIIFGQGVKLFPDLPISERGELFDQVLQLGVWAKSSDAASKRAWVIEKELVEKKTKVAFIEGTISSLPTEIELRQKIETWGAGQKAAIEFLGTQMVIWESQRNATVASYRERAERYKAELETELEKLVEPLDNTEADLKDAQAEFNSLDAIKPKQPSYPLLEKKAELSRKQQIYWKLATKQSDVESNIKFWSDTQVCQACSQPISDAKRQEKLIEYRQEGQTLLEKLAELGDLGDLDFEINRAIDEEKSYQQQLYEWQNHTCQLMETIKHLTKEIARIQEQGRQLCDKMEAPNPYAAQIEAAEKENNPYLEQIQQRRAEVNPYRDEAILIEKRRKALTDQLKAAENEYSEIQKQQIAAEYWTKGFKKIRLFFVNKILNALEVEINSACSVLGLTGWQIKLGTETESKTTGNIKLGINVQVKSPSSTDWVSWEAWSGGEQQRLRLGMAMGLASLIQRASGVRFEFEVWDEPSSWLSPEGIEDLLEALRYRSEAQARQIWIVDHRALTFSGFSEIWTAVKEKATGTKVQLISQAEGASVYASA